jgi:hypothetical protein
MTTTDPHPPKPKRRWYQFSLRTLLVLVLLASVGLSWFAVKMHQARRQREAVQAITKAGGAVAYYHEVDENWKPIQGAEPPTPAWLRRLLGDDFFEDVVGVVALSSDFGDAELEHVGVLTELGYIYLLHSQVTDAGLKHLEGLANLEDLYLCSPQVTDAGLKCLDGLTGLKALNLYEAQVTDAGLAHLGRMATLEYLVLSRTQVSDAGLERLKGLTSLEYLALSRTQVTDAGLNHLNGLTKLKTLILQGTHVTEKGVKKLQKALPGCKIHR